MRRLLFIEDDPDSLEMLTLVLEQGGYSVTTAANAPEAVRLLGTQTFDLVITDLLLDTRGIEASWKALANLVELARPASIGLITAGRSRRTKHAHITSISCCASPVRARRCSRSSQRHFSYPMCRAIASTSCGPTSRSSSSTSSMHSVNSSRSRALSRAR